MRAGYARSRERDQARRDALEPLAPGERPRAVTIAAAVAAIIAAANLALWAAGWDAGREDDAPLAVLGFSAVMLAAAAFMWRRRYWAVLAFQALLGVTVLWAGISLLVASNLAAAALALATLIGAGTLFWFLIRAMARLQMPRRPER
jgi:hypothetical protein